MSSDSPQRKRFSFGKLAVFALAGLVVLLGAVYFVATSSGFITGVILPRASKAAGATITADSVALKPFSSATIKNLRVATTGAEPLVAAPEAVVRYDLMQILKGNIVVNEVTLTSPQVNIITAADGSSNLDPLLKGEDKPKETEPTPNLDIHNISLKNATVRMTETAKSGAVSSTELTGLNLTLDQLKNAQPGKVSLDTTLRLASKTPPGTPVTNDVLQARLTGAFTFAITADLLPQSVQGEADFAVSQTEGAYRDLAGLSAKLQANLTPTQIENLRLQFQKGQTQLGGLVVSGPFNAETMAANLQVQLQNLDRNVLNLSGMDFAETVLNSTNAVEIASGASAVVVTGNLAGQKFSLVQEGQRTPPLDLRVDYQVSVNLSNQTAVVRQANVSARQNQSELIGLSLEQPLGLAWGAAMAGVPDSTLRLTLTNFNLAEWTALTGTNLPAGRLGTVLNLRSESGGKRVNLSLAGSISDLATVIGTNQIRNASLKFDAAGNVADLKIANIDRYSFDLAAQNQPVVKGAGSAKVNLETSDVEAQLQVDGSLPELLKQVPVESFNAQRGALSLKTTASLTASRTAVNGELQVASLDGSYDTYPFRNYGMAGKFNIEMTNDVAQLHAVNLNVTENGAPGGQIDLAGRYNLTNGAAQITFKTAGLNQAGLRPFLTPSLGDKKLVSAGLEMNGSAAADPTGKSEIKSTIKLENLVVNDPSGQFPASPLGGQIEIDAAMGGDVIAVNRLLVTLTPTARAKNQLQAQGNIDMRTNNPSPSDFKILAESLDVTPYYDLFAKPAPTNAVAAAPPPAQPQGDPNAEPEPIQLPLTNLTASVKIDRFYLRQAVITNLHADVLIRGSEVTFKTAPISVNGGPVSANAVVDVGIPGYKYDIAFDAVQVPVQPLADSFSDGPPGKYSGAFSAQAKIQGAGVTGRSLQNSLKGNLNATLTNLNLQLIGPKVRPLLLPVALVLRMPELMDSPVDWVNAKATMGQGRIDVGQFAVMSPAFMADAKGAVRIANVLSNSTIDLPVEFSLRRSLAEKSALLPANAPTNAAFVALPNFVKLKGTLGVPETEIDKLVISGLLLRSVGGIVPQVGDKTGNLLRDVGGFLSGQKPNTNAPAASTNAPAVNTNKPSALDLLRLLPQRKQQQQPAENK